MTRKRIIIWCSIWVLIAAAVTAYKYFDRKSMIDCTLEWGRLAPFPTAIHDFSISTEGSMFTRAFRASFTASPVDIERWLQDSDGTRAILPTTPSPNIRHFSITPGGGAEHAEVTVDDSNHSVSIYVYWS